MDDRRYAPTVSGPCGRGEKRRHEKLGRVDAGDHVKAVAVGICGDESTRAWFRKPGPVERDSLAVARKTGRAVDPVEHRRGRPTLDTHREETAGRVLRALGRIEETRTIRRERDAPIPDDGWRNE